MCENKTLPIKEGQGKRFENLLPKQLLVPLRSNIKQRAAKWIGEDTKHGQKQNQANHLILKITVQTCAGTKPFLKRKGRVGVLRISYQNSCWCRCAITPNNGQRKMRAIAVLLLL